MMRTRAEIARYATSEVLGLADINDHAPAISHEITAGALGNFF